MQFCFALINSFLFSSFIKSPHILYRGVYFILVLILANVSFCFSQNTNIILGRPTDTSITVSVLFNQVDEYYLEYGTQQGEYGYTSANYTSIANLPEEINLNNLVPNTKYFYRLNYKVPGSINFIHSTEFSFITQRTPGSTFTFAIEADEHLYDIKGNLNMYNVTLQNEANDHPDFMLSLGDIFGDDHNYSTITAAELDDLHSYYRPVLGKICHSIPFYVCLGNHEGEKEYYLVQTAPNPNMAIPATLARKKYFPNPFPNSFYSGNTTVESNGIGYPENYFSWTWGDALFVVLDVYRDACDTSDKPLGWAWSLGLPQYTWLKNTLETSTSKYKFVFAHHTRGEGRGGILTAITNEWGGYQRQVGLVGLNFKFGLNRPAADGWTKPIHQLFVDNKVNIFFQGHDHLFAREQLDSVIYQEVPMPSDSTYNIGMLANADAYLSDTLNGTGHLKVTVSPAYVRVDYIRAYLPADTVGGLHQNGEIAFTYYVRANDAYTFIGNGSWSDSNNWVEKKTPPANLPAGNAIYIDPVEGGECVLNITQNILQGAKIIVKPGKKLIVPGNLIIQ